MQVPETESYCELMFAPKLWMNETTWHEKSELSTSSNNEKESLLSTVIGHCIVL